MDVMKNQRQCKLIKEDAMNRVLMRQQQPQTSREMKQNLKDLGIGVKSDKDPPGTFHSPMACIVSKVFIKNDMKVKKGKRLLVLRAPLPPRPNSPMSLSSLMLESQKRRIKKILKDQLKPTRTKKCAAAKKRAAVKKHAAEVGAAAAEKGTAASAPSAPEDADNTPIPMETSPAVDKMEAVKLYGNLKKFDTVKKRAAEVGAAAAEKGASPSAPPALEDAENTPIPMETSHAVDKMEAAKLYENFKKFDTVIDHSDHYFSAPAIPDTQELPTDTARAEDS